MKELRIKESDYAYSVLINSNVYKYRNLDEIKKLLNYYVNEKDEVEKKREYLN